MRCSKCGSDNPTEKRFCGDCGAQLSVTLKVSEIPARAGSISEGERRHLTVLFCDLVNSTAIAAQLDPEEWREIVAAYHRAAARAIERFGGHVAKYLGDGVMAYFGYPAAHDNDAERAARAGLAILDAISELKARLPAVSDMGTSQSSSLSTSGASRGLSSPGSRTGGRNRPPNLSARVGIHTGVVVVGAGAGNDVDVFGDAPNIAARVQAAAPPDTLLMTSATHRLLSRTFATEDYGAKILKGVDTPIQLYRAVQPSGVPGQFHLPAVRRELSPFVGRDEELLLLINRWEQATSGEGQVVFIVGEAGIGKSRLLQEFRGRLDVASHTWVECAGEQFFESTPFHAISQALERWLAQQGCSGTAQRAKMLEQVFKSVGVQPTEGVPLVMELLNEAPPVEYPPLFLTSEQRRRRLFATLTEWVFETARVRPTVFVVEDLHWADPSTLEFIQMLLQGQAASSLLVLLTARPEFTQQWPSERRTELTLSALSDPHVREMANRVAAQLSWPGFSAAELVVQRATGIPLFVEELTRLVVESGGRVAAHDIPPTLSDSLMARLDRLGAAKDICQVAAVIGHEFAYKLLEVVAPVTETDLQSALAKLTDAGLIYARGNPPQSTYQFKHALIQDAAYEALLKSRRKELHASIAQALTDKFVALSESQPATVARHWTDAGRDDLAVPAWQKVGDITRVRQAFREAEEAYRQALAILENQSESEERDARELKLRSALGEVLQITKGYASAEASQAKTRARVLAERSGNLAQVVVDLLGAWIAATTSGDHSAADGVAERMLELAAREGSATNCGLAHMAKLCTCYYRGDFLGCEKYFTDGRRFFDAPDFRKFRGAVSNTFGLSDLNAWTLGHPEIARARLQHALSAARENESAYDLAFALHQESNLQMLLGEPALAEAAAAQALALSDEHGFPYFGATCQIALGSARAQLGQVQAGIGLIRRGLTEMARSGIRNFVPRYLSYLAAAQASDGALAEAFSSLSQALEANPQELLYRPETLRLRGEVQLAQGQTDRAAADFREALSLAKGMSAKGWELRVTISLAMLLAQQRRRAEARAILAEVYDSFTAGFETADLKNAKTLLHELSG